MADNLERLNAVLTEIEAHAVRLARQAKLNSATPATIMQEIAETVMPLLKDFAILSFKESVTVREYLHSEIEPLLQEVAGQGDSALQPEDAAMIMQRLLAYRSLLDGAKERVVGDEKAKVESELAELDRALARVAEITVEEGEDGEGEDDDGEDDGGDDDEEGGEDESPAAAKQ